MADKKFKAEIIRRSKIRTNNQIFYSAYFNARPGNIYSMEEIRKYSQEKSNQVKKKNLNTGGFQITLKYSNGQYRSGKMTKQGQKVNIWSVSDSPGDIDNGDIVGFILTYSLDL